MQRLDVIPFDMSSELEKDVLKCYILCSFNNKNTLLQGHLTSKCEGKCVTKQERERPFLYKIKHFEEMATSQERNKQKTELEIHQNHLH